MKRRALPAGILAALTILGGLAFAPAAYANHVSCGQTITVNTTLDSDVGPCANNGIIVGADNVTLNLNGFRVYGSAAAADGAGVLLSGRTGVTVTNGSVTDFDGGVVIRAGGSNIVTRVVAQHNYGASQGHPPAAGTQYGDGIAIEGSISNRIIGNVARDNAPFSGIGVYTATDTDHPGYVSAPVTGNLIQRNLVENNTGCRVGPFCDNDGIRLEPSVAGVTVDGNTVIGNGLDGISLFGATTMNTVTTNSVRNNGFVGAVAGDGIRVFGGGNTIQNNYVNNSREAGISVGRRSLGAAGSLGGINGKNNLISANRVSASGHYDLWDSNIVPPCDNNMWHGNTFGPGLATPSCTTLP